MFFLLQFIENRIESINITLFSKISANLEVIASCPVVYVQNWKLKYWKLKFFSVTTNAYILMAIGRIGSCYKCIFVLTYWLSVLSFTICGCFNYIFSMESMYPKCTLYKDWIFFFFLQLALFVCALFHWRTLRSCKFKIGKKFTKSFHHTHQVLRSFCCCCCFSIPVTKKNGYGIWFL